MRQPTTRSNNHVAGFIVTILDEDEDSCRMKCPACGATRRYEREPEINEYGDKARAICACGTLLIGVSANVPGIARTIALVDRVAARSRSYPKTFAY
jgi:hypothetical protein